MNEEKRERQQVRERRKKIIGHLGWIIPLVVIIGGIVWLLSLPKVPASEVVSRQAVHWHPHLTLMINNEPVEIPANVGAGVGGAHTELIHTHDTTGTLHIEMSGPVYRRQTRLSEFFKVWDKTFTSTQILDYQNGSGGTVKMYVNGEPNYEYGEYAMKDGDRIEIRYD